MKDRILLYLRIKNAVLAALLLLSVLSCSIGGFPVLPMSKTGAHDTVYLSGSVYFPAEDLFPIIYFALSLAAGLLVLFFAFALRWQIKSKWDLSKACMMLSGFIVLSGVWILSDSKTLMFFLNLTTASFFCPMSASCSCRFLF